MRQKFLLCKHCGNIVAMIRDNGVLIHCCGEPMEEIHPGTASASQEKHQPIYRIEGGTVHVSVGEVAHPMTPEHYIEWICMETEHGIQYARLTPADKPEAKFSLCPGDEVRGVYAFCNQHELWRNS